MGRHRPTFDGQSLFFPQSVKPVQGVEINSGTHKVHPLLIFTQYGDLSCHGASVTNSVVLCISCRIWQIRKSAAKRPEALHKKKEQRGEIYDAAGHLGIWAKLSPVPESDNKKIPSALGHVCWWYCHQKGSFFSWRWATAYVSVRQMTLCQAWAGLVFWQHTWHSCSCSCAPLLLTYQKHLIVRREGPSSQRVDGRPKSMHGRLPWCKDCQSTWILRYLAVVIS